MKPQTPAESVFAALEKMAQQEAENTGLNARLADSQAELTRLSVDGDLDDSKTIATIARLQIFTHLLPARILARQAATELAQKALLGACHDFISQQLSPRLREVMARARSKVRDSLKEHFIDGIKLIRAVDESKLVMDLTAIGQTATIRHLPADEAVQYAEDLLAALNALEAVSAKL